VQPVHMTVNTNKRENTIHPENRLLHLDLMGW